MNTSLFAATLVAASLMSTGAHAALTISTFDGLTLSAGSQFLPGATTSFTSGAATFNHDFTDWGGGCCWSGWTRHWHAGCEAAVPVKRIPSGNCSAGRAQGLKLGMSTSPVNTLTRPSQTLRPCFCNVEI